MSYYNNLKSKNDIINIAMALGYRGTKSGNSWQGDCPRHGSSGGKCLVIWPGIQGYKCFNCGESGDVIDLVMLYKNMDHRSAVNYLADRVKMPHLGGHNLTSEELAQRQNDLDEKKLVEDMLTATAGWYHKQMQNFPDICDHLENHYGFSKEIIEELQIGFAPPGTSRPDNTSDLANYLNSIPEFKGKLALSGLFNFKSSKGPFWDFFKGRIIFPYWKSGKVVYMIARATNHTPVDKYECYTDDVGNVKLDDKGNPVYAKYKKLRTHDSNHDKRKYISKFIQNDSFMGEDSVRGAREVIITEGAPDWVSAVDYGFAAISPVTTQFGEKDWEKLERLTTGADSIFIINDNEQNQSGYKGALKTGKYLTKAGRNVFLVELPRPDDVDKIDLNEYLVDHTADDLRKLMKASKTVLELLIEDLVEDFPKALPVIKSDIAPILAELDDGIQEHYINAVVKKTKTTRKAIEKEIEVAKKEKKLKQAQSSEKKVDPEVEKASKAIAQDKMLLKKRIDTINRAGVVGERRVIAMYLCSLDSRLLPDDSASPNVLSVKNSGHYGTGKSYVLMNCLDIYPKSGYHLITNGSAKSLYYLEEGLSHKALVVMEGFQFQSKNAEDSEFVYVTRSLISEGCVRYQVPEKNEDGKFVTVEKKLDGPTSFITTTVMEKLEPQLEDRLFTIHPDESVEQTKDVIRLTANMKAGLVSGLDDKEKNTWRAFHESLKPVKIVIPYAPDISTFINKVEIVPIATRRAFKRVLAVIQAIACAYQFQRKRDDKDRVITEIKDYWMALQIVQEAFRENLGQESKGSEERIKYIEEKGPLQYRDLEEVWGIKRQSVSTWIAPRVKEGIIVWCGEDGNEFTDENEMRKAQRSGKGFVKVSDSYNAADTVGLPTPYDLTGDHDWDEGGRLLKKYDLKLDSRASDKVYKGVREVSVTGIDTCDDSEAIENVNDFDGEDVGVRVSGPDPEMDDNNLETDAESDIPVTNTPLTTFKGMEEFSI